MKTSVLVLAGSLALVGCGSSADEQRTTSGEDVADRLESAADQSGPAAKQVLENAADEARQHPTMAPVDKPGSFAQDAMQRAGDAEASTLPSAHASAAGSPAGR